MFHLQLDGIEADCNMSVLMSQSPMVSKLDTTWQSSEKSCFGILFIGFCTVKVKETTNIFTSVEQYLCNIHQQREVLCDKSKASRELSWIWSDSLCNTENLCCSKGWIVLNSELKTSAILTDKNVFWMNSSSCSNSCRQYFFWTDKSS